VTATRQPNRILHLVGAAEDNGGILSTIRGLADASDPAHWEHVLWVHSSFLQVRKPQLTCRYSPNALDESRSHLRLLLAAWRAWPDLRRLLRAEPYAIVHAHSRGALPLAAGLAHKQVPTLFTNHAYAKRTGLYRTAASLRGLRTVLLTPNQARHYQIQPTEGHVDIVSECGSDRFFNAPIPARAPLQGRPLQLVGIGNVVPWKKWDLLLDAIHRLPENLRSRIQATIWGPVPADSASRQYSEELRAAVLRHGLQSSFRLAGPTAEVAQILSRADWFALPSTNEPCSVALIEALASGVPALVSASGGNIDIVQDGVSGAHFTPDSAESLATRLEDILTGSLRPAPPDQIRASVIHRSATVVATHYAAIYRDMLGGTTDSSFKIQV
jgi:glycosyltransferase involved in cell wall biosynthesis